MAPSTLSNEDDIKKAASAIMQQHNQEIDENNAEGVVETYING